MLKEGFKLILALSVGIVLEKFKADLSRAINSIVSKINEVIANSY